MAKSLETPPTQSWVTHLFVCEQAVGLNEITIENVDDIGGWWGCIKYGMGDDTINDATLLVCGCFFVAKEYIPVVPMIKVHSGHQR